MAEQNGPWCYICCTRHEKNGECPGELLATGAERHGWRAMVELPNGPQVFGTLVAPAGSLWRARIMTFPNVLWVVPRGGTMKFVALTAAAAQHKAIEYIRQHCKHRGLTLRAEVGSVESSEVDREEEEKTARSEDVQAAQRQLRSLFIRYGLTRPTDEAATDDLSEGGLFIRTNSPQPVGTDLTLRLEVEGFGIPLQGVVCWVREVSEGGRPAGMGIKLARPHPRYIHYIRQKRKAPAPEHEVEEWKGTAEQG